MDSTRFDQLTRTLATGVSRRQVLKGIVGFVVGGVLGQLWSRPNAYAQAGEEQTLYLPLANKVCSEGSQCGVTTACGDFPGCICIESAEGEIRCGKKPSTCYMPLCTTSADCAHLGPGYFCDVPHSGCCTDPPASEARCIPPCTGDCPREQRCGDGGCCAVGDLCVDGQCVSPSDCELKSITLESMRGALAELAAGATTANLSPQGCIQVQQRFTNGELVGKSFLIGGKKVSDWLRTHKQWAGYRDADLDGFYEWRSATVEGDTPDERRTSELVYDPETQKLRRRTTLDATVEGVHVKIEEADANGVMVVTAEYDAPLEEEVALSDEQLTAAAGDAPAATCEANPCNPDQIKARMDEGVNLALQCLGDLGDRGLAMYEAAYNTLAREMTVRCAPIRGDTQANIGGWDNAQGPLTVTVDPAKYCRMNEGGRAWLLFHEILHPALQFSHNPAVKNLPLAQRNQIDRLYGCVALCYTHKGVATKCMCAQCLDTKTCDPLCAAFNSDCGATCPCPAKNNQYYETCNQCLAGCPSGLTCKGYLTCTPVGQSANCPPVTCP